MGKIGVCKECVYYHRTFDCSKCSRFYKDKYVKKKIDFEEWWINNEHKIDVDHLKALGRILWEASRENM